MTNVQIENGYTKVANELLNALIRLPINGTQFRIVMLILRETYGFQRKECSMSESYIATKLGIQRQNVHRELKFLIDHNVLSVNQEATFTRPRIIAMNKHYDTWLIQLRKSEMDAGIEKNWTPVLKKDPATGITSDSHKKKPLNKPLKEVMSGAPAPDSPTAIELILNDKSMYLISRKQVTEWSTLYPAVDVMQELRKMKGWLDANPIKRKTKRGILRFVNSWLAREQDMGHQQETRSDSWGGVLSL